MEPGELLSSLSTSFHPVQWAQQHHLLFNGPRRRKAWRTKVLNTHYLLSLLLPSLVDLGKGDCLGKELKTRALQEGSAAHKWQLHRQLILFHLEPVTCEMITVVASFT